MSDRVPVQTVEIAAPSLLSKKARSKVANSDRQIHTRSFTGLFRNLRIGGGGLLFVIQDSDTPTIRNTAHSRSVAPLIPYTAPTTCLREP
ncbi:hypothetical protein ACYU03_11000 [Pseudomonas sp. X10]